MSDEGDKPPRFSRRKAFRLLGTALTGGILASVEGKPASAGYGGCTQCGCGAFNGARQLSVGVPDLRPFLARAFVT